jgi:hypothetical protein
VYRYVREAIALLAAMAPTLDQVIEVAAGKAFVILDGTLLCIDRVSMSSGRDRPFYSGKHKTHGVNVQAIADRAGWYGSPRRCPARGTTWEPRSGSIIDAFKVADTTAVADTAYQGGGAAIRVPQRRRRIAPDTSRYRRLSANQKDVNTAHA